MSVTEEDFRAGVLRRPKQRPAPIPSPRDTLLPRLSPDAIGKLPYPPDLMPGRREVPTPYGTMRVNEWGPPNGRRVLFLHGDATFSPMWARIAWRMAQHGCRVMTMDFWGRGYTDSPYPMPHTSDIFKSQILYAINSSPVPWTATSQHGSSSDGQPPAGFSIVGFSFGGAVAVDFGSEFPHLVNSIVALAPAGLLRRLPPDYMAIYGAEEELSPSDPAMRGLAARIQGVRTDSVSEIAGLAEKEQVLSSGGGTEVQTPASAAANDDWINWTPGFGVGEAEGEKFLADLVQFQFDWHEGHVKSFYSSARYGPTHGMQFAWRRLSDVITGGASAASPAGYGMPSSLLRGSKVLVIFGAEDPIVVPDEYIEDICDLMPRERVEFVKMPGGHSFVWPNSEEIAAKLASWWGLA